MTFSLISPVFADGQPIPQKYTRLGENLFPPLKWTGTPEGTQSFALIVEDPDATRGLFRHCVIINIPGNWTELPQAVDTAPDHSIKFIKNDFGNARYDGPQPPAGTGLHHYWFRLAALDAVNLSIPEEVGAEEAWKKVRKHLIEEAAIVGTFEQ
ncbi:MULTISPECIES: YbhB/YbcL family Raf kinase inhibitor-like protein [Sinorhizobium]|uniref:YbhB/YbcL family Raf kinase inhibitor-like protein n=1 Tax=Sinorhizobium psoraleae TaxID=520838 RepID=A0ABT4KRQ9_9HYPH|nr:MULTISPECIES: YbhB/YbcL family Raf kinase inhibitor-like protein [Sinorhizobium]MCZ4094558.1 YbhB/YbcL family Raf kinase inhibitor-like protein [Sinorhizobium psoraleae]MDK1385350.1 YbhB/YbcL family Raf kinase inhibitor-like protein [Sinorhizobium sp. 7-81]